MICASGGAAAPAPTDSINPSRSTTVPLSMTWPGAVTIRTSVMAKMRGASACALAVNNSIANRQRQGSRSQAIPGVWFKGCTPLFLLRSGPAGPGLPRSE